MYIHCFIRVLYCLFFKLFTSLFLKLSSNPSYHNFLRILLLIPFIVPLCFKFVFYLFSLYEQTESTSFCIVYSLLYSVHIHSTHNHSWPSLFLLYFTCFWSNPFPLYLVYFYILPGTLTSYFHITKVARKGGYFSFFCNKTLIPHNMLYTMHHWAFVSENFSIYFLILGRIISILPSDTY